MTVCLPEPVNRFIAILGAAIILSFTGCSVAPVTAADTDPQISQARPLADVLEIVTPAVVNIAVTSRMPAETNPLFGDPYFRRFFDLPPPPSSPRRMSAGSGVIVDAQEGYVLTNHHVIEGAEEIAVTLKDRRRFAAELIGSDKATDIAVLRIEADNLTALPPGDPDALRVGDDVVAIGNPFGLGQTVTSGIVSALGRSGINLEGYEDFIQTDASINPGNSGGALVTADGRLIGINTAIIAPSGGNVGIGFAVPIDMAAAVMTQIIEHGEVRRGRLGVTIQDLTPDLAEALGVDQAYGAIIASVEDNSPAAEAGLEAGDIIVAVDGRSISSSADLRNRIGLTRAGSEVEIVWLREGARNTVRVRVEPDETYATAALPDRLAGASFQDASGNVFVDHVEPGSSAALAGLRTGDVIVAVNRNAVRTLTDLTHFIGEARGTIALDLFRGGSRLLLVIR
ncbi:DegQ family serine endoprotease [Nitratireductor mangrovi]|uniref:DegQ family serine endoprotease n=1 Tax=Nitratireductor mangrovi TaxID=2599600 RepID=A0A5B8L3G4_9HYPH|nr:DegQ family serine endoprotease [Nitratireductor mangrovi]QDZ02359.1 DegQ family serine endoprotease [Nitratireductor mangrovi]